MSVTEEPLGEGYDAHETLKPKEPPFTLQGGDPLAPATVLHWVDLARERARWIMNGGRAGFEPEHDGEEYSPTEQDRVDADVLLRKATSAEHVAWEMQAYQRGEVAVPEERASYNDLALPDGSDRLAIRKALIRCVTQLQNARGIAKEVEEKLSGLGILPDEQARILEVILVLGEVSDVVEPRRGAERT